jgi:hypothetical protein
MWPGSSGISGNPEMSAPIIPGLADGIGEAQDVHPLTEIEPLEPLKFR